ncbi:hypothetical protein R6Z07F_011602 [Ovis aries]
MAHSAQPYVSLPKPESQEAVCNLPASWQDSSRQRLSRGERGAVGTQAAARPPPPSPPPGAKSAVLAAAGAAAAGGAEALHHCSGLAGGAPLPRSRPDGHLPAAARSQRRDSTRPLIGAVMRLPFQLGSQLFFCCAHSQQICTSDKDEVISAGPIEHPDSSEIGQAPWRPKAAALPRRSYQGRRPSFSKDVL